MPLALLNGTTAALAITVQPYAAGGASVSGSIETMTCHFGSMEFSARREVAAEYLTFCSNAWTTPIPGRISADIMLSGYVSKGVAMSNPLLFIDPTNDPHYQLVQTFDTGCFATSKFFTTLDSNSARAFGEMPRQIQGRVSGEPSATWVVA